MEAARSGPKTAGMHSRSAMSRSRKSERKSAGQTLVEFALVMPILFAFVGAVIQFGMVFWTQNTLTQIVRDTGRWAATQTFQCSGSGYPVASDQQTVYTEANLIAGNSSLLGYTSGEWTSLSSLTASPQPLEGVSAAWVMDSDPSNEGCPPKDNQAVWHVTIRIAHVVPVFFPGFQFLPGWSTCDGSAAEGGVTGPCALLSSQADFRIEPAPAPLSQ